MQITWLGHACFLIETLSKTIITDPFSEEVGYTIYNKEVDFATISHDHYDHNAVHTLKGKPKIINNLQEYHIDGISFKGISSYHDKEKGAQRGFNIIHKISAEGINVAHLGDLGHLLDKEHVEALGKVNILLVPVGGIFTIDAQEALRIVDQLQPSITIPMHYKTPHLSFQLAPVEDFISHCEIVTKKPYLKVDKADLELDKKVILLDYLSWLT